MAKTPLQIRRRQEFIISGMTRASCALRAEQALSAIDGEINARVNLVTNRAYKPIQEVQVATSD